jgi:hypothetical protein
MTTTGSLRQSNSTTPRGLTERCSMPKLVADQLDLGSVDVTRQWWTVEMATHTGRWEPAPFREPLLRLMENVRSSFPWLLVARE